jgi:hypothetical protein
MPKEKKRAKKQIATTPTPTIVLCQVWEESEQGWGVRPDGYSLHTSQEALTEYVKTYWEGMPEEPPTEYSRPEGFAYLTTPNPVQAKALLSSPNLRVYDNAYPPRL